MRQPRLRAGIAGLAAVALLAGAVVLGTRGGGRPAVQREPPRPAAAPGPGGSAGVLGLADLATRRHPVGAATQQTMPAVTPAAGGAASTFTLALTDRSALGAHGSAQIDYRIAIAGPFPRCTVLTEVVRATRGARIHVTLAPTLQLGWCRGEHRGVVLLEANPNCPGGRPCVLFKTRFEDVGHFRFVVR